MFLGEVGKSLFSRHTIVGVTVTFISAPARDRSVSPNLLLLGLKSTPTGPQKCFWAFERIALQKQEGKSPAASLSLNSRDQSCVVIRRRIQRTDGTTPCRTESETISSPCTCGVGATDTDKRREKDYQSVSGIPLNSFLHVPQRMSQNVTELLISTAAPLRWRITPSFFATVQDPSPLSFVEMQPAGHHRDIPVLSK